MLGMRITRGNYPPLPRSFSGKLQALVKLMLNTNTYKRPSIYQILKQEIVQNRIQSFLTQTVLKDEFSHTVFHKQQIITKDGKINQLETPSGGKPALFIEEKKSEDRRPQPIKTFDPQIEKAKIPTDYGKRPPSTGAPSSAANNYHYKNKADGYQVGFNKPSYDVPKTRPKYTPPSISEEEQRRRAEKEKEREEIRRKIEEKELKNKEAQKKLEQQRLEQWRKDYEEKQKREYEQKKREEQIRQREKEKMRAYNQQQIDKQKQYENVNRSNAYYQARYEAELNKRKHQEMERRAANNIFGYDEQEIQRKNRPSTAAHGSKDRAGDLSNKPNYHYQNRVVPQRPPQEGKFFIIHFVV
jgi:hypothetical protein